MWAHFGRVHDAAETHAETLHAAGAATAWLASTLDLTSLLRPTAPAFALLMTPETADLTLYAVIC